MDREKVIKGLESLYARLLDVAMQDSIIMLDVSMVANAIDLLKEQEAVEPKKENDGNPEPWTVWWYVCGDCGQPIDKMDRYCRRCGKRVKWE